MFTNLGAIREDKVRVFSGGGPDLLAVMAIITKQSPEGTALTFPLYHPDDAAAEDAILYGDLLTSQIQISAKSNQTK